PGWRYRCSRSSPPPPASSAPSSPTPSRPTDDAAPATPRPSSGRRPVAEERDVSLLVVDVGTSSIRAVLVDTSGAVTQERRSPFLPDTASAGSVSFDAAAMADLAVGLARTLVVES